MFLGKLYSTIILIRKFAPPPKCSNFIGRPLAMGRNTFTVVKKLSLAKRIADH